MRTLLALFLLALAGCSVQTDAATTGTLYTAPCQPTEPTPSPVLPDTPTSETNEEGATPEAVVFKAGQAYFFCPNFPCPACDRIDARYVKIKQPYPAGFGWVNEYGNSHGWPVMYWKGKDGWHRRVGYEGVEKTERLLHPPQVQAVQQRQGYPVRGSWWTHPGDVWSHLQQPPHNFSADYVRTLSRAEAESLHSDDHEGRTKGNPPRRGQRVRPVRYSRPQQSRIRATAYYCPPGGG